MPPACQCTRASVLPHMLMQLLASSCCYMQLRLIAWNSHAHLHFLPHLEAQSGRAMHAPQRGHMPAGNKDASPSFHWAGVLLITVALCCDALTANLEEQRFFRGPSTCMQGEVVCLLSSFAAAYCLAIICVTGGHPTSCAALRLQAKHAQRRMSERIASMLPMLLCTSCKHWQ